jgi:hypothetical protein
MAINIRIVDRCFSQLNLVERHDYVWKHLESLGEKDLDRLGTLLLLSPTEARRHPLFRGLGRENAPVKS